MCRPRPVTVCAFSPGGLWTTGDGSQERAFGRLQRGVALGRFTRPVLPVVYRSALLRRLVLRDVVCHGERISAARALEFIDDGIGCPVLAELCAADWIIERLDPPPCPITIAWGQKERLVPDTAHDEVCERIPRVSVLKLPDVGHVPMVDDPQLVARTILSTTGVIAGR